MKLHLNLTLRRALLAAMAMVALHTADADMTPTNGHMYVTGEVSLTTTEAWTEAWGSTTGVLSVGTSAAAGTLTLTSGTYTTPNSIFLGGKGYESNGSTASDGTLNIQKDATLTANGSTNVGNSQIGGTGTLTLNGGTLNAGNALYVGVNAGSGTIEAEGGATITVASGSTGAVFAMSHRTIPDLADTVTLTGSTITVGAKGGVVDYTTIGHSAGTATLKLEDGSTANFHDQLLVGEKSGSNGTIHVHSSTLNMGTTTVLGYEANATGTICLKDGIAQGADILVIGSKGTGTIEMMGDKAALAANSIELGDAANSEGTITSNGGTISTRLLTIGDAGTGTVTTSGTLTASAIVLGNAATGIGTLNITGGTVSEINKLYVGYQGTGTLTTASNVTATNMDVVGTGSSATATGGTLTSSKATVVGGTLATSGTGKLNITKATIAAGGKLSLASENNEIADLSITKGSSATFEKDADALISGTLFNDGEVTIKSGAIMKSSGSATNDGTIKNEGSLNILNGGSMTSLGTIINYNTLNVSGKLTTNTLTNTPGTTGTTTVAAGGTWNITGDTLQSTISNSGDIVIKGAGHIMADKMEGTGDTTIVLDGSTVSTGTGVAVIQLTEDMENVDKVKVAVDTADASQLVGKQINFLQQNTNFLEPETNVLTEIAYDNFSATGEGDKFIWDSDYIELGKTERKNEETGITTTITEKLNFTESNTLKNDNATGTTHLYFGRYEIAETTTAGLDLGDGIVSIDLEVKTETVISATENVAEKAVTNYVQEIPEGASPEKIEEIEEQNNANKAASEVVVNAKAVNKAEVATGNTMDETINVLVGKDVASTTPNGGSVQVKSTIVNQHTKFESGATISENIDQSGLTLVFEGDSTHEKEATSTDKAVLGFAKETTTGVVTVDGEKHEVKKIDIVEVKESANVTVDNIDMHATHAVTIGSADGAKTTLELNNVNFHVGGETDVNVLHLVRINEYDENQNFKGTKLVAVESENHLTTKSTITNAEVKLLGNTILKFEELDFGSLEEDLKKEGIEINREEIDKLHGNTTITDSDIVLKDAQLGETDNTDDEGKKHNYQEIVLENTNVKGSGKVKNTKMKGGRLSVGNSPGELTVTEFEAEGKTVLDFTFITNSEKWTNGTGTAYSGNCDTTHGSGNLSKLLIDKAVTFDDIYVTFVYEEKIDGTTEDYTAQTTKDGKAALANKVTFADGDAITLIDNVDYNGDLSELSGSYTVDYDSLPTLADDLFWDVNRLFTTGKIYVIGERLEEPWRIANTLVSAGETVLGFGRLAEAQASLREAGTTRTWGSAIAMFDSIDSGSTTNGYDYSNWGAAVGIDHAFTKNTVVGVAFGCTWGENEAKEDNGYYSAGSIDQDAKMIGIYGVHKFQTKGLLNDVKLSAFAAYGMFENDSTRSSLKAPGTAKAEWDSDAWVLSASLSRDITTDSGVVFTPYVGVEYTKAGMDDFTEKGRVTTADYTADEDYSNLSVKVGVGVSKTYGSITPYANVAFISDVDRSAAKVTATGRETITGKSALPGRNGFEIGVGATWQLTENLDVNAGYSAEIRDKATEHNARLGVGYTF